MAGLEHGESSQAPYAARVLALLAAANVLNFYDRALPAVLVEPIKDDFGLDDTQVGVLGASFIVAYAASGIWLGRLADHRSRRTVMAWGLVVWSACTALSAGAWSFVALVVVRLGVGVGEASYAPAAHSLISDIYPAPRRSRAVAAFQLGIPLGTILAFFSTGPLVEAFGTWRAPFLVAAVPGVVLAIWLGRITEPHRGEADGFAARPEPDASLAQVVAAVVAIPTMRWLIVSGIGVQIAAYSVATFLVPFLQRYFHLSLTIAAIDTGIVLGLAGLVGLVVGGVMSDRVSQRSTAGRVGLGAVALGVAAPLAALALLLGEQRLFLFVALMTFVQVLQFFFHTSALPAVADVVPPTMRGTAIAVFFAAFYLFGGAFGPLVTGLLSDALADPHHGVSASAHGLRLALLSVVAPALLMGAVGLLGASRHVFQDRARMAGSDGRPLGDPTGTP